MIKSPTWRTCTKLTGGLWYPRSFRLHQYINREDVILLCQDYYYKSFDPLTFEERVKLNFDHPDAFDTELLTEHLIIAEKL